MRLGLGVVVGWRSLTLFCFCCSWFLWGRWGCLSHTAGVGCAIPSSGMVAGLPPVGCGFWFGCILWLSLLFVWVPRPCYSGRATLLRRVVGCILFRGFIWDVALRGLECAILGWSVRCGLRGSWCVVGVVVGGRAGLRVPGSVWCFLGLEFPLGVWRGT